MLVVIIVGLAAALGAPHVVDLTQALQDPGQAVRGSHLSNTTCLTQVCVLQKWRIMQLIMSRQNTHKMNEAALDK